MSQNKPKILYIVTQPEFGGAQRYIYDLAKELRGDFDVVVAAGQPNELPTLLRKCEKKEIKTRRLKYLCRQINPIKDILAIFEIKKLLGEEKPDILHLNSSKAGVLGSLAGFIYNLKHHPHLTSPSSKEGEEGRGRNCLPAGDVPKGQNLRTVYTVHGWVFLEPLGIVKKLIYFLAEWFAGQFRDATIVLSEKEKFVAIKFGLAKQEKTFLIRHGIKPPEFIEREIARKSFNLKNNEFAIGTVANFYQAKGLNYLIEAANILNSKFQIPNSKFIIVGEGGGRKKLEMLIKKYKLEEKIILFGALPKAQKYLKAFDLFVLPSVKEGFPYALIEAMHAGLPIVSTAVGGIPEMIDNNKNGVFVPPKNPQALAKKINELIKNYEFAKNLGLRAVLAAQERFSLEKMVNETKEVYYEVSLR